MKLADAIDGWGSENRDRLSSDELQALAGVWRTIRSSDMRDLDFDTMSREDAGAVMGLFPPEQRSSVSETLNHVREWALAQRVANAAPASEHPPDEPSLDPMVEPVDDTPVVVIDDNPAPVRPVDRSSLPGSETVVMRRGQPVADPQGAVDGWEPPQTIDEPANSSGKLIAGLLLGLLVVVAIWYFATRGDDETPLNTGAEDAAGFADTNTEGAGDSGDSVQAPAATSQAQQGAVSASGASDDFCGLAAQLAEDDPIDDASTAMFSAAFFDRFDQVYAQIGSVAPAEIASDVALLRSTLSNLGDVMERNGYDPFAPELSAALEEFDATGIDAATERISQYTLAACGIDLDAAVADTDATGIDTGATGGIDTEALQSLQDISPDEAELINDLFLSQFGIDEALAECLTAELGDLTEAVADPSILNQEVCGTTLFAIISGIGG